MERLLLPQWLTSLLLMIWILAMTSIDGRQRSISRCSTDIIHISNESGNIQTPGYPKRYRNRQVCIWRITAPKGFKVKVTVNTQNGFGIEHSKDCLSADSLVISSRRQTFQTYGSSLYVRGPHTLIICGTKPPPTSIVSPDNVLWLRFKANERKGANQIGFQMKYSRLDINECTTKNGRGGCQQKCYNKPGSYQCLCRRGYQLNTDLKSCGDRNECNLGRKYHGCSHSCQNIIGSYKCICPYGMELDWIGKTCIGDIKYLIHFANDQFKTSVNRHSAVGTTVLQIVANAKTANKTMAAKKLSYRILEENNSGLIEDSPFDISAKTGVISLKRSLKKYDPKKFELIVEAILDSWIRAKTTVLIFVNDTMHERNTSHISFKVLIQQETKQDQIIFNLSPHYPRQISLTYNITSSSNYYFTIDKLSGDIKVSKDLPMLNSTNDVWRSNFNVTVLHTKTGVTEDASIMVIMIPSYPGEKYLTDEIIDAVNKEIAEPEDYFNPLVRNSPSSSTGRQAVAGLHRLFRKPSIETRQLSKAKLFFDLVLNKITTRVKENYAGRERSSPIILSLGTGQIVSPETLSRVVESSKCHDILPMRQCTVEDSQSPYRSFDGSCNNLKNPLWGAAPMPFRRILPAKYYDVDGLSDPIGFPNLPEAPDVPTPHEISRRFFHLHKSSSHSKDNDFSHMLMQWGQFIDHDITFTSESEGGHHCVLPRCDGSVKDFSHPCLPIMYEDQDDGCTMFIRSAAMCQTNRVFIEPRQQLNSITSYIDGSMIYGSSQQSANQLRQLDSSGLLRMSKNNLLPLIEGQLSPPLSFCIRFGGCFSAGDVRVNEQVALASMHTMMAREHNRIVKLLSDYNQQWDSDKIYQEAKKIVGAQLQHITYTEYLPKILGVSAISQYNGYHDNVDSTVANVVAAAAFRFGHSMVRPTFSQLDANFDNIAPELPLVHAFFNNTLLRRHGIERFLFGLIGNSSESIDNRLAYGLSRQLFQRPGAKHGFDIAALNLQRGRDHGIAGYGYWRRHCNLTNAFTFSETKNEIKNPKLRNVLKSLYNDRVDNADLFVSGLAESPVEGSLLGKTFHCLIKEQFQRLRDGDRFYYEEHGVFTSAQLAQIRKVSLARIMCDNLLGIVSVQKDVFKSYQGKNDDRIACDRLPGIDLTKWREHTPVSDGNDPRVWSAWVHTIQSDTGSWSSPSGRNICNNKTIDDIECRTSDGRSLQESDETVTCDNNIGVYCRNIEQALPDTICGSYKFRFLCGTDDVKVVKENKAETPFEDLFLETRHASMNCSKLFNPNDYAVSFPVEKEAIISSPLHVSDIGHFLFAGRSRDKDSHRFLLKYDLRQVKRQDIVHSAKVQLFYAGEDTSNINVLARSSSLNVIYLETYLVSSSDWHPSNVTSRLPWHLDNVGIGDDTLSKRLSQTEITINKPGWIEVDVYIAVRLWRISVNLKRHNYGLLFRITGDDNDVGKYRFASNTHPNEVIRPRLLVCLTSSAW